MIDQYTFGKTPASLYLARRLSELNSPALTRACTVRVNTFNQNTQGIYVSVGYGVMTAKVGANLLRLLREDASKIQLESSFDDDAFVSQLLRNVIIGRIKQVIRQMMVVRKVESAGIDENKAKAKGSYVYKHGSTNALYKVLGHTVGGSFNGVYRQNNLSPFEVKDEITPETLMNKSNKRCARQGKPHMAV